MACAAPRVCCARFATSFERIAHAAARRPTRARLASLCVPRRERNREACAALAAAAQANLEVRPGHTPV